MFVGRESELRDSNTYLARRDNGPVIINVHGTAGIGKSTFTRQLEDLAKRTGSRTAWLDLDQVFSMISTESVAIHEALIRESMAAVTTQLLDLKTGRLVFDRFAKARQKAMAGYLSERPKVQVTQSAHHGGQISGVHITVKESQTDAAIAQYNYRQALGRAAVVTTLKLKLGSSIFFVDTGELLYREDRGSSSSELARWYLNDVLGEIASTTGLAVVVASR